MIRALETGESAQCEAILRSLPEWFGIEQSILEYRKAIETMQTWVATEEGEIVAFLTVGITSWACAEIHVMAVREGLHGSGIGRGLVIHAESDLTTRGVEFLQVKTMGPSRPNAPYARTRGFYERMGFFPLEEVDLWGPGNPCLIFVKHLRCRTARLAENPNRVAEGDGSGSLGSGVDP